MGRSPRPRDVGGDRTDWRVSDPARVDDLAAMGCGNGMGLPRLLPKSPLSNVGDRSGARVCLLLPAEIGPSLGLQSLFVFLAPKARASAPLQLAIVAIADVALE